uniref:RHS repeat-associated core domain-containing protein n=1 Tax=Thiobacillus thioparus TaxID=931 RepID=UPI001B7F8F4B
GMIYYRARYYDPAIGRFISRDPAGMPDGVNRYAYVNNNPVNFTDPMGLKLRSEGGLPANYFNMTADAGSLSSGRQSLTDVRGGMGSFSPQQQRCSSCIPMSSNVPNPFDVQANALQAPMFSPDDLLGSGIFKGAAAVGGLAVGAIKSAGSGGIAAGVKAYEVGLANKLRTNSLPNDGLQIHHVGQGNPMSQIIPGYQYNSAPAIVLPTEIHQAIPTVRGAVTGTARSQLAKDILDLRRYTDAPNSSLRELINLNKSMYPESFRKP